MSCSSTTCSHSALSKIRVVQTLTIGIPSPFGWMLVLKQMHDRWRQRQALLDLDDRLLDDIGITREEAARHAGKSFRR